MTTWLPAGTPKTVHLLRGADAEALLADDLRSALAGLGVRRLQLNLDDEPVAAGLRLAAGDHPAGPITGVVSLWGATDHAAAHALLAERARAATGWHVDERRRLDPPETYEGGRADALANVAVLRRPAGLDDATWRHRWLVEHTPIAIRTQATSGYVQNIVLGPVTEAAAGRADERPDAIVEELFPTAGLTDPHAFHGSGGDDAELTRRITELMTSVARIGADHDLDLVPSGRRLWDL